MCVVSAEYDSLYVYVHPGTAAMPLAPAQMQPATAALLLLLVLIEPALALKVVTYASSDVPGDNLQVETYGGLAAEQTHVFEGSYPTPCIEECVATPTCHGFVVTGQNCWFRGAFFTPENIAASRVPAGDEHTLYVLYDDTASSIGLVVLACGMFVLCFASTVYFKVTEMFEKIPDANPAGAPAAAPAADDPTLSRSARLYSYVSNSYIGQTASYVKQKVVGPSASAELV